MSTPHRADGTPPGPGYPQRRQASAGSNGALQKMGLWGIGSFLGGLVAVIVAIIIHDHAAYPNMLCNTGFGQLGQVFDNTVRVDCGVATTAESVVGWLVAFGVISMVGGLGKVVLGLATSAAMPTSVPRPAAPPAGPVMPERPATWAPPPPPPGSASASPFSPEA